MTSFEAETSPATTRHAITGQIPEINTEEKLRKILGRTCTSEL